MTTSKHCCPLCRSSQCRLASVVQTSPEELDTVSVIYYGCGECGQEFSDEIGQASIFQGEIPRCVLCGNPEIKQRPHPALVATEIWECLGCGEYFGFNPQPEKIEDDTFAIELAKAQTLKCGNPQDHRCPHCYSNKWTACRFFHLKKEIVAPCLMVFDHGDGKLETHTVHRTMKVPAPNILVRYRCDKCHQEFLLAERGGAKIAASRPTKCGFCGSPQLNKLSAQEHRMTDYEVWHCKLCRQNTAWRTLT